MIEIDNILISDEIQKIRFCCDLESCLGACCVEGDAGAPLEESEISIIEDYIEEIKPYMRKEGMEVIEKNGIFDFDTVRCGFALCVVIVGVKTDIELFASIMM